MKTVLDRLPCGAALSGFRRLSAGAGGIRSLPCTLVLLSAALSGCAKFGHVEQGQVIDYDRSQGRVTLIADSNYQDPTHPRFDVVPPLTIRIPADLQEMGPEPESGKLLHLDRKNRRAVIFDSTSQKVRTVEYTPISEQTDACQSKSPVVDRANRTITACTRDRRWITFSVAEELLALPDDTWKIGDEIRYYYKDPGRALRLMNVSKTDLNQAGG